MDDWMENINSDVMHYKVIQVKVLWKQHKRYKLHKENGQMNG
jgi:hypothetical protein